MNKRQRKQDDKDTGPGGTLIVFLPQPGPTARDKKSQTQCLALHTARQYRKAVQRAVRGRSIDGRRSI